MNKVDVVYVDTDFLIVLLREEDELHKRAQKKYEKYKRQLVATPYVLIELFLVATDWIEQIEKIMANVLEIVDCTHNEEMLLKAAYYMDELNMTTFDAVHCAYTGKGKILSSDEKFDETAVERIEL